MSKIEVAGNREFALRLGNAFKSIDWLIPPYFAIGFLKELAVLLESAEETEKKLLAFGFIMGKQYDENYIARMYTQRYSKLNNLSKFSKLMGEVFDVYFLGYKSTAVSAAIPIIEGVVRSIALDSGRDLGHGTRKIIKEFDKIVQNEINSPNRYDERLVMLEMLRDFIKERLFQNTDTYIGLNEFNRHGIVHGIYKDYGNDLNFLRIITILDLLCFVIALRNGGSPFAPPETKESKRLALHYQRLRLSRSGPR